MSFDQALEATERCRSQIIQTECKTFEKENERLSAKYECPCVVYFKCEDEQETGSFKYRGAVNSLLMNKNSKDFFTYSTGNHGAALSKAAQVQGKNCSVIVTKGTPQSKIDNIRKYGGIVKECEGDLKACSEMAINLAKDTNGVYVSTHNAYNTIYGQGTMVFEILKSIKFIDIFVISIGGGGFTAGVSVVLNKLSPSTTIVIVSPKGKNLKEQFATGKKDESTNFLDSAASGIRLKAIGNIPFEILRNVRNPLIFMELEDEEMINGCQQYWKISGKKVEMAAGATIKATLDLLPSELIKKYSFLKRPIQIVSVVCGRNYEPLINFE